MSALWPKKEYHVLEWVDYAMKYGTIFEWERKLFGGYKEIVHQTLWGCTMLPVFCACYRLEGDRYIRVGWHWKDGRCLNG